LRSRRRTRLGGRIRRRMIEHLARHDQRSGDSAVVFGLRIRRSVFLRRNRVWLPSCRVGRTYLCNDKTKVPDKKCCAAPIVPLLRQSRTADATRYKLSTVTGPSALYSLPTEGSTVSPALKEGWADLPVTICALRAHAPFCRQRVSSILWQLRHGQQNPVRRKRMP
jgi:hypothetical protein